jgi:hypothetical protein
VRYYLTSVIILCGKSEIVKGLGGGIMDIAAQIASGNRLNMRGLLRALADGWLAYLPALRALDAGEVQHYLVAQGYPDMQDLLAHVTAWCEDTLGVVPTVLQGGERLSERRDDDPAYTVQAVARSRSFGCGEVERRFIQGHVALDRMLAYLPEAALEDITVYDWLYTTIVEHFNAHRPPNLPLLLQARCAGSAHTKTPGPQRV